MAAKNAGRRAVVLAALLVAAPLALALAGAIPGVPSLAVVLRDVGPVAADAPPAVVIATPDGSGATGRLVLAGSASDDVAVQDVLVRVDRGPWRSVDAAARGASAGSWSHTLEGLAPGRHLIEVRAFDGRTDSLPAAVAVKWGASRRPPAVTILDPADGAGVADNRGLSVSGVADAEYPIARVRVTVDGVRVGDADLTVEGVPATAWSLIVPASFLPPGEHVVGVTAFDVLGESDGTSLERTIRVASHAGAPAPALRFLSPLEGAGVSASGPPEACATARRCVRVAGVLDDPAGLAERIVVSVDGGPWTPIHDVGGGVAPLAGGGGWSMEWPLDDAYAGKHEFRVRAETASGVASVTTSRTIAVASPHALAIEASPGGAAPTLTRVAVRASWPDGTSALDAAWRVDGEAAEADGVGVLGLHFERPGLHDVEAIAWDDAGRSAHASVVLHATNRAPVARAAERVAAFTNTSVALDASASSDADGDVLEFRWSFGDGRASSWSASPVARHAYARPGTYEAFVVVRDALGVESAPAPVDVTVANARPVAGFRFTPEDAITVLTDVEFVDATKDADGPPVAVAWDFGDGRVAEGRNVTHRFDARGQYRVQITAWDAAGAAATATREVVVANLPPSPAFSWTPIHPKAGESVAFRDLSADVDGHVTSWRWDFGDGNASAARSPSFTFARAGNFPVTLEAVDDAGARATVKREVWVGNAPPFSNFSFEPREPRSFDTVRFRSMAADVDGRIVRVNWSLGDGAVSNESNPTHTYHVPGVYNVTLTAWDDGGAAATYSFLLDVLNLPPTVRIVEPADGAFAGVATTLAAHARDRDGRVARIEWRVQDPFGAVAEYDSGTVQHVFAIPGVHQVTLSVRDDAGAWTNVTRDVQVDEAPSSRFPPSVTVEFPKPGGTFLGAVRFTGTATSPAPLTRVELSVWQSGRVVTPFASPWVRAEGVERWGFDFDSRTLDNGEYDLVVRAWDARGAVGEARVPIVIGNVDYGDVERISLGVLTLNASDTVHGVQVVRGTAYHPQGLAGVRVAVDGGRWADVGGAGANWAYALDSLSLANGDHSLTVRAYRSPAVFREVVVPFEVENHAPRITVTKPMPRNASGVVDVTGGFVPDGPAGTVYWRVDHAPWVPASGSPAWVARIDSRDIANGNHTLSLKAISPDGLESPVVTYAFNVQNEAARDSVRSGSAGVAAERDVPAVGLWGVVLVVVAVAVRRRRE